MGRITEIRTSGDNDTPIFPEKYKMHYLYCDHCGSFDLETWKEPENHKNLEKLQKRLSRMAIVFIIIAIFMGFILFQTTFIIAFIAVVFFVIAMAVRQRIKSKIKVAGIQCNNCGAKYEDGSSFFTSEENPRNLTMGDVPLPLNKNYHFPGESLGLADEE